MHLGCVSTIFTNDKALKVELSTLPRIGERTEVSNAILMGNDSYESLEELSKGKAPMGIGADCYIRNAIIDKDARIADNVRIHGSVALQDTETDAYSIRSGIIVVRKGAYLPSGTRIGLAE